MNRLIFIFLALALSLFLISDAPEFISRLSVIAMLFLIVALIIFLFTSTGLIYFASLIFVATIIIAAVMSQEFRLMLIDLAYYSQAVLIEMSYDYINMIQHDVLQQGNNEPVIRITANPNE